ncbi:MAG: DUF4349 domain-containing protein [Deltaproteobacteria bacterium]|nr:DUF4349 domain-containing protein [Deltaproteobacteria bacterium]
MRVSSSMLYRVCTIAIAIATVACGPSTLQAVAPSVDFAPPPPPPPLAPLHGAAAASLDPASPHARELRGEQALGKVAHAAGRVRLALATAKGPRDRSRRECLEGLLTEIEGIERIAATTRAQLRTALFENEDEADAAFTRLEEAAHRAEASGSQAGDCEGSDPLTAGGFGPNDATIRVRPGPVRMMRNDDAAEKDPSYAAYFLDAPATGSLTPSQTSASAPSPSPAPAAMPASDPHDASLLLRNAQLALAVFEVEKNVDAVESIAKEGGGYLALRGDRQITVRIPKARFDDAVRRIERLGDVLHRNVSAEDVTDQYVDLEMRLKNSTLVRARLEKLLEHATVKDAIEIHRELATVTEEIERLQGKLKLLRDRVAFATITVSFERTQSQQVRTQALLPFPWMQTMGLMPLLRVSR